MALLDEAVALIETGSDGMIIISELERSVKIGLLCMQDAPGDRPDMSAVVAMLTSKTYLLFLDRIGGIPTYSATHTLKLVSLVYKQILGIRLLSSPAMRLARRTTSCIVGD